MNRLDSYGRIQNAAYIPTYTWAQLPISASRGSFAQVNDYLWTSWTAGSSAYTLGTGSSTTGTWTFEYRDDLDSTYPWRTIGGAIAPSLRFSVNFNTTPAAGNYETCHWTMPPTAGQYGFGMTMGTYSTTAGNSNMYIGTTSATGTDIAGPCQPIGGTLGGSRADDLATVAASKVLYSNYQQAGTANYCTGLTILIRPLKVAGAV